MLHDKGVLSMFSGKLRKLIAAGAVAVVVAVGGYAIGNATSGDGGSGSANAAPAGEQSPPPPAGQSRQPPGNGQGPHNLRPRAGAIITGAAGGTAPGPASRPDPPRAA